MPLGRLGCIAGSTRNKSNIATMSSLRLCRQCTEGFDTPVPSPLPLAILFQRRAYRVLGEH